MGRREATWREAIRRVLAESNGAMHYKDIAEKIVSDRIKTKVGATPANSANVALNDSIRTQGEKSPFQSVGNGEYILRDRTQEKIPRSSTNDPIDSPPEDSNEEQYGIVSSFGMFWRRDYVDWVSQPRILGMQQIGAESVDFSNQIGIYLLYDGREVVYVGRSTERPLGKRLYEHTLDRLGTRWNRFSWFGLLPVSDKGKLGIQPDAYKSQKIIPALEAILIEALEPRQNRKRGDDLSAVEYLQKEDPEIDRKKKKALLESALAKV